MTKEADFDVVIIGSGVRLIFAAKREDEENRNH